MTNLMRKRKWVLMEKMKLKEGIRKKKSKDTRMRLNVKR